MARTDDPSVILMSFDAPRKDYQSGVFISKDDSNVLMPDIISSSLEYSKLEIIADDYVFQNTNEYPHGFVLLNVNYEL